MNHEESDQKLEVSPNYIAAFLRFKWHITATVIILSTISVFITSIIPSTYRSEGIVLVETQQIPTNLIQSTVTSAAEERIQIIKQRVMTRSKLIGISNKFPELKEDQNMLVSELHESIRSMITVVVIGANNKRRGAAKAISFKVAFEAKTPALAQSVASELVTLFLNENVKSRTERATETTNFLKGEARRIQEKLNVTEHAMASYKQENKDALPEHLKLYTSSLDRSQRNLNDLNRQIEALTSQKAYYEVQFESSSTNQDRGPTTNRGRLNSLYGERQELRTQFTEEHPDLIRISSEIAFLEKGLSQESEVSTRGLMDISAKLSSLKSELQVLHLQRKNVTQQIDKVEERILRIPQVERGLISLNRDYETVKRQYDLIVGNSMQAQLAENLEEGRKAERFSILEPPQLPERPFKPDRKKLLGMAIAFSIGLPLGIVFVIGFFDKSIRGAEALTRITGAPPLIVIGYIETEREKIASKKKIRNLCIATGIMLGIGIGLFHFLYMPIDLAIYKIIG